MEYPCGICGKMLESPRMPVGCSFGFMIACSQEHWDMMQKVERSMAEARRRDAEYIRESFRKRGLLPNR